MIVPSQIFSTRLSLMFLQDRHQLRRHEYTLGPKPTHVPNIVSSIYPCPPTAAIHSSIAADASLVLSIPELGLTSDMLSLGPVPSLSGATTSTPFFVSTSWTIDDGLPERWWPHTHGTPKLYNLSLTLRIGDAPLSFNSQVGFRTIRLAQTRYPDEEVAARGITPGDQWHFEVNGVTFYSKGTSVVPFDPFYARVTDEQVRWLVESAVQSGQNMVRFLGD